MRQTERNILENSILPPEQSKLSAGIDCSKTPADMNMAESNRKIEQVAVRILSPSVGETRYEPVFNFVAHLAHTDHSIEFSQIAISGLVEQFNSCELGETGVGSRLIASSIPFQVAYAPLSVAHVGPPNLEHPERYAPSNWPSDWPSNWIEYQEIEAVDKRLFEIRGSLDLEQFRPVRGEASKDLLLSLRCEVRESIAISNSVRLTLSEKMPIETPCGGLDLPAGVVVSDFCEVSGWAMCEGDEINHVLLRVGEYQLASAETGVESKSLALSQPDLRSAAYAKFSKTVPLLDGSNLFNQALPLAAKAEVSFRKSEPLSLTGSSCRLITRQSAAVENVYSEIESISINSRGVIVVSGWIINSETPELGIAIDGVPILLGSPQSGPCNVSWIYREDLDKRFPSQMQHSRWGFLASIHANFLPACLETVELFVNSQGTESCLGTLDDNHKLKRVFCSIRTIPENKSSASELRKVWSRRKAVLRSQAFRKGFVNEPLPPLRNKTRLRSLPERPERILYFSHNLAATEGLPKIGRDVVAALKKNAPSTEFAVFSGCEGLLRRDFERLEMPVSIFPELHTAPSSWEALRTNYGLAYRKAKEFSPHLIYVSGSDACWGVSLASELGCPVVWMIQESTDPLRWQQQLDTRYRMHYLHALTDATRIIFPSISTQQVYQDLPGIAQSVVVPNGVDLGSINEIRRHRDKISARENLSINQSSTVISIIGTTTPRKGQDEFLQAMKLLEQRLPQRHFVFLVVGSRELPFLEELKNLALKLELVSEVRFVPEQPDVSDYFLASDIQCICSREEAAPLVSLEALAFGIPLVSTQAFGLAEQLVDGENSLCYPIGNPGRLCESIERLLLDSDLRSKLVSSGNETVKQRFSLERCMELQLNSVLEGYQLGIRA